MGRSALILGRSPLAEALADIVGAAGFAVHRPPARPVRREDLERVFTDQPGREGFPHSLDQAYREAEVVIQAEASERMDPALPETTLVLVAALGQSAAAAASKIHARHRVVGFAALPPLAQGQVVEVAATPWTEAVALERAAEFFRALGLEPVMVPDGPGLVFARILSLIINEAAFALMEGVATAEDIDAAMRQGTNFPLGPLEWADRIGLDQVVGLLEGLQLEYGEERYRPAPLLRRLVRAGHLGRASHRGFYAYGNP